MTPDELDRLATLIAREIARAAGARGSGSDPAAGREPWLPPPIRPPAAHPDRGAAPPPWSGAAQSLGDIAPSRDPARPSHRDDVAEATRAVRAAAAGKGPDRRRSPGDARGAGSARPGIGDAGAGARNSLPVATRRRHALPVEVPVGVSKRHLHLSAEDVRALFGTDALRPRRALRQPGQFAAEETVVAEGASGRIDGIRVVGPARGATQLELARSDAAVLGVEAPLAASGTLDGSAGGVTLIGAHGRVTLRRGVIVAARHLHLSVGDGHRWGFADGDRVTIECGDGARRVTWHEVLVRCGDSHATEFHLDEDEAHAAGVASGATARVVAWAPRHQRRRPLLTEAELLAIVRRGDAIPADAIVTPAARDRARVLGIALP